MLIKALLIVDLAPGVPSRILVRKVPPIRGEVGCQLTDNVRRTSLLGAANQGQAISSPYCSRDLYVGNPRKAVSLQCRAELPN